jgi:hypothetical protein
MIVAAATAGRCPISLANGSLLCSVPHEAPQRPPFADFTSKTGHESIEHDFMV